MVVGAIAAICLILGVLAFWIFVPHGEKVAPLPPNANDQWILQKAKETGGDVKKLSPSDQMKLIQLRGESGPSVLKHYAETK
jgi:hypothetical protein